MSDEIKTTVTEEENTDVVESSDIDDNATPNSTSTGDTPIYSQDPFENSPRGRVKKLRVGDHDVIVSGYYPYCYNYGDGKHVLRFNVNESDHSFNELQEIFKDPNMPTEIQYLEDEEVKEVRTGYTRDFETKYSQGIFSCEITQVTETELRVGKAEKKIDTQQENVDMAIAELTNLIFETMTAATSNSNE